MGRAHKYPKSHDKYVGLPHVMVISLAFRSLRGGSIKVFIELCDLYNGKNNGEIHLGSGAAAKRLHMSKSTVYHAFEELSEKGFIECTEKGNWLEQKASTWRLTHRPDNRSNGSPLATNEWRHWVPSDEPSKSQSSVPK